MSLGRCVSPTRTSSSSRLARPSNSPTGRVSMPRPVELERLQPAQPGKVAQPDRGQAADGERSFVRPFPSVGNSPASSAAVTVAQFGVS